MLTHWKRILGTGITILAIVVVVLVGLSTMHGHFPIFTTPTSWSMEPSLHHSDLVLSVPFQVAGRFHQVTEGDIIVFNAPAIPRVWCHRVVGIEDGKYITQGDNNRYPDSFITSESDILGIVPSVGGQPLLLPYLGSLLAYFNYHFALRIVLLAACLATLIIMQVRERKKPRVKRPSRLKVPAILFGAAIAIFALMFLPSISKSGYTAIGYQVAEGTGISSGRYGAIDFGIMQIGTSQSKELTFQNEGLIPAVAAFHILDDEFNEVSISSSLLVLGGKSQEKVNVTVDATKIHDPKLVRLAMTTIPYLMPAGFTSDLASKNPWLPGLVIAAVPALLLPMVLYPLLPRIRRRRASNKRKKPGFPLPKVVIIAPLVLAAAIMGAQYMCYAQISVPVSASFEITEHESASIAWAADTIEIPAGSSLVGTDWFTITNNLDDGIRVGAKLTQNESGILTSWAPGELKVADLTSCPDSVTWKGTLDATEVSARTEPYYLVFHIYAHTIDNSLQSDFPVTVTVTVVESDEDNGGS